MGTNYYLIRRTTPNKIRENKDRIWRYNVEHKRPSNEGSEYIYNNDFYELTNGWVFNNTYYKDIDNVEVTDKLHIGKNFLGWRFLMASYPELGISTIDDWKAELEADGNYIIDEYNTVVPLEDLYKLLFNKSGNVEQDTVDMQNRDEGVRKIGYDSERKLCIHSWSIDSPTNASYDMLSYADFS